MGSGGIIARALVADPKLLLYDEPTGDLDPDDSPSRILGILRLLNTKYGKTVIIVTHDPQAARHARRAYLDKGEFVEKDLAA